MKAVKFYIDQTLWERFYRAFPGHGERSALLRKIVRYVVVNKAQHTFAEDVGEDVLRDLEGGEASGRREREDG